MELFHKIIKTPIGNLLIQCDLTSLRSVIFTERDPTFGGKYNEILENADIQLCDYFYGKLHNFDLPLSPEGTNFQKKVWKLLQNIGWGETKNYGEVALELGSASYSRAVGSANGSNPIPIIIPCHRVIGSNGSLTGYSGGLERKKWLLLHESVNSGKLLF